MLDLKIPIKKMPVKRTMEIISKASGKPKNTIKTFYKNLGTYAAKKVCSNSNTGTLNQNDVKKLIKDSRKQGLFLSEEKLKQEFGEIAKEEKQRRIKYGKLRNKMSERLEKIKDGHFESSSEYKRIKEGRKNKKEQRLDRVHAIMMGVTNQNKNNPSNNNSGNSGWTTDGQKNSLNENSKEHAGNAQNNDSGWSTNTNDEQKNDAADNSKKPKKDAAQNEQPLDLFID